MNLDSLEEIKKIDSLKVGDSLKLYTAQLREAWEQSVNSDIPVIESKSVIISGMGGSSNAGKIIESLFEKESGIPITVFNDYGLPNWVGKDTLVVVNTYSGNTEETLSALKRGLEKGSKVLGVTTGGKVGILIQSKKIYGVILSPSTNPTGFPKSGLGVSLGGLMGALKKAKVISVSEKEFLATTDEMDSVREGWLPDVSERDNLAKQTAKWLQGAIPVLFGGRPFLGSLQAGRNAMDEISRNFSLYFDFPEVNHVLIEATQKPDFVKEKLKYLFFNSEFNHKRVRLRYKVTQKIFKEQNLSFKEFYVWGTTKLSQALAIPHFCAWVGFYLAMLDGKDPGPEPWIIKLKDELGQPTH